MQLKLGFLASHGGSSMLAILDAIAQKSIDATAGLVISNNPDSKALSIASRYGVPNYHLSQSKLGTLADLDEVILATLIDHGAEIVILSGYMRKLGHKTLSCYQGRILNIHPSLLPKFGGKGMYGMAVHEAVIRSGENESGASVHIVDKEYDTGAVLLQSKVSVLAEDTAVDLARRVRSIEPDLFFETLKAISSGAIKLPSVQSVSKNHRTE
ncbi:MAG: phosphoribosylglycinamide formyltransferase [Pseudomonadota bacterium]